jgi:ATP-dependent Clp protease adaptor protein ClpS
MGTELDVVLDERVKSKIREPSLWRVVIMNDNATPFEFVIHSLVEIFRHSLASAELIAHDVHEKGAGVAGTYSFEIAEAKSTTATKLARDNDFPLQYRVEEE